MLPYNEALFLLLEEYVYFVPIYSFIDTGTFSGQFCQR